MKKCNIGLAFLFIMLCNIAELLAFQMKVDIPLDKIEELHKMGNDLILKTECLKDKVNIDSLTYFHIYFLGSNNFPKDTIDFVRNLIPQYDPKNKIILAKSYVFTEKGEAICSYDFSGFFPDCDFDKLTKRDSGVIIPLIQKLRKSDPKIVFQFIGYDILAYFVLTQEDKIYVYRIRTSPEISYSNNKENIEVMTLNDYLQWKNSKSKH